MALGHAALSPQSSTGTIVVNIFDSTRKPFTGGSVLFTLRDGNQNQVLRDYYSTANISFTNLPVFHNFGDNYAVIAFASGFRDAGFYPVKIGAGQVRVVDLMLMPNSSSFNFFRAKWDSLGTDQPDLKALFAAGLSDDDAGRARYGNAMELQEGKVLACMMNIVASMRQALLPQRSVLDYLKEIIWDVSGPYHLAQDRVFAWADPEILTQLELARQQGQFVNAPFILHPGATKSYKQVQFGEANLQLTFHENDRKDINAQSCVLIEPDIDYYKDPAAHLLLEVLVNAFGSITDPKVVYCLRWIAGRQAGIPEFDPLYIIEKA